MIISHSMDAAGTSVGASSERSSAQRLTEGQRIELQVIRQLQDHRYLASFGGRVHVVDSTVDLRVGSRVQAAVVSVGEQLQLRYSGVRPEERDSHVEAHEPLDNRVLAAFQSRFGVALSAEDQAAAEHAMTQVQDPAAMAAGALFLSKQSLPVNHETLLALYQSQTWHAATIAASGMSPVRSSDAKPIAHRMEEVLTGDAPQPSVLTSATTPGDASQGERKRDDGGQQDCREHTHDLLNIQNGGSVRYRYGVLPVLLGNQLVELDLAHFQEQREETASTAGMRRMVMTFTTRSLGRIEVTAQSIADHLNITIRSDSALSNEALQTHAAEVGDLVARLGWRVGQVSYEADSGVQTAASHVVDHVLRSDVLSVLL
jgi:hypothetical protein